jgi:hypothetical protein
MKVLTASALQLARPEGKNKFMKHIQRLALLVGFACLLTACGRSAIEIPAGSTVTIEKQDGVEVRGTLIEVQPEQIVVDAGGVRTEIPRREIRSISATSLEVVRQERDGETRDTVATTGGGPNAGDDTGDVRNPIARLFTRGPEYREVTIPAGTLLPASLQSALASDATPVEAPVRATLRRPVLVDGVEALPAGTTVYGTVTSAQESGRVKGRAALSFRFNRIDTVDGGRAAIASNTITRVAPATKKKDAAKIAGGAAGGAIVGGLIGGGDGAAKGAAVGGAAGTGVVLATKEEEVRLAVGTPLSVRLTSPLTVRVPAER